MTNTLAGDEALTFRAPSRWLMLGVYVLILASMSLGFVGDRDLAAWEVALRAALLVLIVVGAASVFAMKVRADRDGVQVVNQWGRRRSLPWEQVYGFELRGYWHGLGLWTTDRRWIRVMPYSGFENTAFRQVRRLEVYRWDSQHALGLV